MDYILFTYRPNKTKINGFFDEEDGNIYINSDLCKIAKEIVLAHEIRHRRCFKNKCKCWGKLYWAEYHAFRAEFEFVLSKNKKSYWKTYFDGVISDLRKFQDKSVTGWREHFKALSKVCRLKKFIEQANKYKYLKKINTIIER